MSSNESIDWLEEYLNFYEFSDFNNLQSIGSGSLGNVVRANWKMNNYSVVLEYADSGTLNDYLSKQFHVLDWNDKFQLALQLASAVECIHDCDIVHRNLHASNILVHQNMIKLADFGFSKKIAEESKNISKIMGVPSYVDPKELENPNYKLNKKSDVYSIGVLMCQISSGKQPFHHESFGLNSTLLTIGIINGKRETIIDGTPTEYSNLYQECWNYEPNKRPNIQKIVLILKSIISFKQNIIVSQEHKFTQSSIINWKNEETKKNYNKTYNVVENNDLDSQNNLIFLNKNVEEIEINPK
ncbi:8191_t:CDS:2, partial [Funneliformis geosporum]